MQKAAFRGILFAGDRLNADLKFILNLYLILDQEQRKPR